jgi:alkylation response protein AidB-like acyl-CoA dehydrogenase
MDLELTQDQALLAQTLEKWVAHHMEIPADGRTAPYLPGDALADELETQGFYAVAAEPELGALGAILLIEAVGKTPWAIEVAASALLAPMLKLAGLPRPLAMMRLPGPPVARFLKSGGCALVDSGDHVRLLYCEDRVEGVESRYAYPFGEFKGDLPAAAKPVADLGISQFRGWRRIAVCAEAVAAMHAALDLTVDYVRTRVQFGRPIGSFQAVQHRLAECSVLVHGARLMLYRAAVEGVGGAETTAIAIHDAVKRVLYETSQFHGAIGLTLEYPLHLWSYRLRILQFELAEVMGAAAQNHAPVVFE